MSVENVELQSPQLSISDLQLVLNLIELTSQRGVFKGAELSAVGALYDRINTFVTQFTQTAKTADATNPVDTNPVDTNPALANKGETE
jgi:hypothetical protein